MVLVDTSIWVEHLRAGHRELAALLNKGAVIIHPFIIGELGLGARKERKTILELLGELPHAPLAEHEEVMTLIHSRRLMGSGIGWVDTHLIASALIAGVPLWTADRKLRLVTVALGILY